MDQLHLGPNGALMQAMEFLLENSSWLSDSLGDFQDDYLILDCPGQIELYTHSDIMKRIVGLFEGEGYRVVAVYLLDSQFMADRVKFMAGMIAAF
jgi:GTPase SAR1 family protein